MKISPSSVNFGSWAFAKDTGAAQQSGPKKVTVTNPSGKHALPVTFGEFSTKKHDFFFFSNTCAGTLKPRKKCVITLGFSPSMVGRENDQLTIRDNAANNPQVVTLTGEGVAPALKLSTESINFGRVPDGGQSSKDIVLVFLNLNPIVPITIETDSIKAIGPNDFSGDFGIHTDTCSRNTLGPGKTCKISISFAPKSGGGPKGAELDISDDASGSPQKVKLTGTDVVL